MWLVLFLLLSLSSCGDPSKGEEKLAEAVHAKPQEYTEKSVFYGVVQALKSSPLLVRADGFLIWTTQPGDKILKSSIIARIDNPETQKVYELALNAEAITQQQHKRSLLLEKSNATSRQQIQEREHAWVSSQQELAKAETEQKKSLFIAPFDGVMGPHLIHEGTHVKTGEIIGYIFNPTDIVVEVQIPATFKDTLRDGITVIINKKRYTLPRISKILNPTTHMMIAHIPIQDPTLLVGEVIDAEIHLKQWKNVIVLPLNTIKFEREGASVLVLRKGILEKREVMLGAKDAKQAVVTKGIEAGEIVCLDPHHFYEGEKVIPSYAEL